MPYVNIKYQLTLDATVILAHLEFHGVDITPENTTGEDNFPDVRVFVDDALSIDLLMAGFGEWKIAVWVIELDGSGMQIGEWIPLAPNQTDTFRGEVSEQQNLLLGDYLISWP